MTNDVFKEPTISETGTPPETRIRSVQGVRSRIEEMRQGEETRSMRRALINGMLDGNPPYKQSELDLLGRSEDANINLRTGEGDVDTAKTPYYDLWSEVPRLLSVKCDYYGTNGNGLYGKNGSRAPVDSVKLHECGEIISDELHKLFKAWDGLDNNMQRKQWWMCVHGIGMAMFEDTLDWRWKSRTVGDVLVPDDAEADIDLLDECAIPRTYLPTDLYNKIKNASAASKWDIELARKAIMAASPVEFRNQNKNTWEPYQDAVRTGDVWFTNKSNRIPVIDYLKKEFDGRITHTILLEDQISVKSTMPQEEKFLFKHIGRFDSFKQVLSPFFFDVIGYGYWHGVKGLGPKIYDFCGLENRLTCKNIDQAMLGLVVVPKTSDDWETIETVSASGVTIFRPGTEFVQTKLADNLEGPLLVKRDLQGTKQGNTGAYRQRVSAENSEPTLGQAQLNIQQQTTLTRSAVNRYYNSLDRLWREMVRRVLNPKLGKSDPGGKEAHQFRDCCIRRGVPEELLDMKYITEIRATRAIGNGSPMMQEMISNKLLALTPTMKERGKNHAFRVAIAPFVGQSNVDAFYPPFDEADVAGEQEQNAINENNALRIPGGQTKVIDSDNHLIHFDIAYQDMASHVQELQGGQTDPMAVLIHLQQGGAHAATHLQGLSQDPTREQDFKPREQALIQISKVADKLQQEITESLKSQQQQQGQQQQISDELRADMMKIQGDLAVKKAKTAGDIQLKSEKQAATLRLKDLQTAADIRRKNIESAAEINRPEPAGAV